MIKEGKAIYKKRKAELSEHPNPNPRLSGVLVMIRHRIQKVV